MSQAVCRGCNKPLEHSFVDLGMSPLCESFLAADQLNQMEAFYPLHVRVCDGCFLVQLEEYVTPEDIFTEYAYFSSYSTSWIEHARRYVDMIVERLSLGGDSFVVELASNDGYLLQHFLPHRVPVLGVEPARNVAKVAIEKGVPSISEFFGRGLAKRLLEERGGADLIIGNNVLAQVPSLDDFVGGMAILLAERGVVTMEFPHLLKLVDENQFDTIYHEHFSYFSLYTTQRIFRSHGLELFDVEELPTHGGSLRIYAARREAGMATSERFEQLMRRELDRGIDRLEFYLAYTEKVHATKRNLLEFLIQAKRDNKTVVGYGAPGKGNTLLNFCGIREDFLQYTVDRNPYKHGRFTPGTHIPIHDVDRIAATKPDYLLILPWNLKDEIRAQTDYIRDWGGKHVVPIPSLQVLD